MMASLKQRIEAALSDPDKALVIGVVIGMMLSVWGAVAGHWLAKLI
jgi:hypothetical protein